MAKSCPITGKHSKVANRLSNRIRATQFNSCGKTRRKANMQKKRLYVPEIGKSITVTLSTKGMRTVAKQGAHKALLKAGLI